MSEAKDNKQANTPVGAKCRGCSSSIAKEHAQCTNCQSYYHPSCAKQAVPLSGGIFQRCCGRRGSASTSDEIRDMLKLEMLALRKDFKNDIKIELAPVITSVNGLKSQVQTFTEQFQKRISSIKNTVTELDTRIELNANTINTNNEKITELTNRISETQCLNDNIVLLREVDDRMARRNNALFLGINEPNSVSSSERLSNDLSQVQGICDTLVNKVEIVSCSRIDNIGFDKGKEDEKLSTTSKEPLNRSRSHSTPKEGAEASPTTTSGEDSSWREEFEDCQSKRSTDHSSGSSKYFSFDSKSVNNLNLSSFELTLYYQNVRGLNTKLDDIFSKTYMVEYDIFAFSETWLKSGVHNSEIFNNNYSVFRCDRREEFRRSGGGVLIACRNTLNVVPLKFDNIHQLFPQVEIVGILITNLNIKTHIVNIYIPPDLPTHIYSDLLELLSSHSAMEAEALVLLGDFNSPQFLNSLAGGLDRKADLLINFSLFNNLRQFNEVLNSHDRILDLVLSSIECMVNEDQSPLVKSDSYHPALRILVSTNLVRPKFVTKKPLGIYNFHKIDISRLLSELELISWEPLSEYPSPDEKCKYLYNQLDLAISKSVPRIKTHNYKPSKYPPWFTADIIYDCKMKETLHHKYKESIDTSSYLHEQYRYIRKVLKAKIKLAYKNYIKKTEEKLLSDPRSFWSHIKSKKTNKQFPSSFVIDNNYVDDSQQIVNSFALFFSSVYERLDDEVFSRLKVCNLNHIGGVELPIELDIMRCIKKLPNKMSAGLNGIPCKIVKECSAGQ
ncbi:uncharacterized protein LOC123270083 [Cotesia glomerata]|uniref:uncharacterized protein LOC123270083 n=1 Tax=Cotesia glomerata TaxID=32391 RepID=UPI001D03042A|nr:uncharacterized protein LOC123270083 [Cotesia glomerata]